MAVGFGQRSQEKKVIDNYIGKYVVLFVNHQSSFSGLVKEIKDGYVLLMPHVANCVEEGKLVRKLINEQSIVREDSIVAVEPATRETLEVYCRCMNEKDRKLKKEK